MEIDELYNKFSEYDIKWISLLCQKKVLTHTRTLFARLQVELENGHVVTSKVMGLQMEVFKARISLINQRTIV
jgi:hypothetical protein